MSSIIDAPPTAHHATQTLHPASRWQSQSTHRVENRFGWCSYGANTVPWVGAYLHTNHTNYENTPASNIAGNAHWYPRTAALSPRIFVFMSAQGHCIFNHIKSVVINSIYTLRKGCKSTIPPIANGSAGTSRSRPISHITGWSPDLCRFDIRGYKSKYLVRAHSKAMLDLVMNKNLVNSNSPY